MIHFVYAGAHNNCSPQAPYTITRHVYDFLASKTQVTYHQWDEVSNMIIGKDDILLGHPHYDERTIVQQIVRHQTCKAKLLIHPFHTNRVQDNIPFDHLVKCADKVFSICGPYWTDTIDNTPFASWKPKIIRLDMAVNLDHYQFFRTKFNSKRNLLYVGSAMPQKNLGLMRAIMSKLPNVTLHCFGGGGHGLEALSNVVLYPRVELTKQKLMEIVNVADVFINTSISDASPTAMLEAAAIGFPIMCTKESGIYNQPMVTELSLSDINYNAHIINTVLNYNDERLMGMALETRKMIEHTHTWDKFNNKLWDEVSKWC